MLVWLDSLPLHSFDVRIGDRNQVNKDDSSINNELNKDCSKDTSDIKEKIQSLSGGDLNGTSSEALKDSWMNYLLTYILLLLF